MRLDPSWLHWSQTRRLVTAFAGAGAPMRFVGGAVRDAVLERRVTEVDAATPLPPDAVTALLKSAGIQAIPTGVKHGTVTAVIDGKPFEVTTLRKDVACDGRHAEVAFTGDWEEDARRRDFTINAMSLSPDGELFDYLGGIKDAKDGRIRFIGDPDQRIAEDHLRILRFFRFHAHYGKGAPDGAALDACRRHARRMDRLSGERVRQEIFKLLAAEQASATLGIMREGGVLAHALGFGVRENGMMARFEELEQRMGILIEPFIKLSAFVLHAEGSPDAAFVRLCKRFKLPSRVEKTLRVLLTAPLGLGPGMPDAEQKRAIRMLGALNFTYVVLVTWAFEEEPVSGEHPYRGMLRLAAEWTPPKFPVKGDDLIRLGIRPGKPMGELLRALEDRWEKSGYSLTREELLATSSKRFP